jgi:predicted nucleic acid-binding protein
LSRGFLLDTNILSETRRRQALPAVTAFIHQTPPERLFVSVLSLGEIRKGIALKARSDAAAALALEEWLADLAAAFSDRVLPVDRVVAECWGRLSSDRPKPVIDMLLAATARVHDLVLVTRNVADAEGLGVPLFNPWLL